MKKRVLVTGGAGYIGSVLVRQLLIKGFLVRVIDNLRFGGESIVELLNMPEFEFHKGDVRNQDDVEKALENVDFVVHLAAIVGDPACAKEPDLARSTNLEGTKMVYNLANAHGVKRFVFASTCSNYGKMKNPDAFLDETSELSPVSLYAETKVGVEQFLLSQPLSNVTKPTCLRFSTVYGLSPRIRLDLTVNEFTKELALGRVLVVFGEQFWRPYCHVTDLARSVIAILEASAEIVSFNVFNVGDTSENYQKQMIVDEIRKFLPEAQVSYVTKNEDPRDYKVSFQKIRDTLDFHLTMRVPDGIRQIKQVIEQGFLENPDAPKYKNT